MKQCIYKVHSRYTADIRTSVFLLFQNDRLDRIITANTQLLLIYQELTCCMGVNYMNPQSLR